MEAFSKKELKNLQKPSAKQNISITLLTIVE